MTRCGWALAAALATTGCPRPAGGPAPPEAPPADPSAASAAASAGTSSAADVPRPVSRCGLGAERVDAYAWLPRGADVVASVDVASGDSTAAIERLTEHVRSGEHGLAIDIAFAIGQWNWQVALVRSTLASAGLEPGELVYSRLSTGSSAWSFAIRCDFDDAAAAMETAWGIEVRRTATGAVGSAAEPDTRPFAYDVVFLEAERVALVPAGGAAEFTAALTARPDPMGRPETPLGAMLQDVETAPIRVVVRQGARIGSERSGRATTVRATATDLEVTVTPSD